MESYYTEEEKAAFEKILTDGQIPEGYHLLSFIDDLSDNELAWTYYPPDHFRILVYEEDTDSFILSEPLSQYTFDTTYSASVSGNEMTVTKNYNFVSNDLFPFLMRCLLIIAIEAGIAWLMGLRDKKGWKIIIVVNVMNQILLNLFLGIIQYQYGNGILEYWLRFIPAEIAVAVIEMVIYRNKLKLYLKHPVFVCTSSKSFQCSHRILSD